MNIDIEELMWWAMAQAPSEPSPCGPYVSERRAVRLEFGEEAIPQGQYFVSGIVARVYLRDPRCFHGSTLEVDYPPKCECGPIAERRLG
jgi:hypothetical protein